MNTIHIPTKNKEKSAFLIVFDEDLPLELQEKIGVAATQTYLNNRNE